MALAATLLFLLTGCTAKGKQTWRDWTVERDAAATSAGRSAVSTASFVHSFAPQQSGRSLNPAEAALLRLAPPYKEGDAATVGEGFDLAMRNPGFPATYIAEIHLDVSSPDHLIRLVWEGPAARDCPAGPWRSNIGRGNPGMDCDTIEGSNTVDSRCTPKGTFFVAGFADRLNACPTAHYCTWVVHAPRYIALHSFGDLPTFPASAGCVRLTHEVAKLIHNNAIAGVTLIRIDGKWTPPARLAP